VAAHDDQQHWEECRSLKLYLAKIFYLALASLSLSWRTQAESLIELFKSIHVFGRWAINRLPGNLHPVNFTILTGLKRATLRMVQSNLGAIRPLASRCDRE
jgi:hypothetical protein